ncbi:MAG: STAS/SEC14 domain-containing protein [Campylobacterales bacterium]|nr:STAS/SEC14 domain-containing protein [Campylobacterales bacterium]
MFRAGDEYFMSMKVIGTLTHADYEKINPILDSATTGMREPKIKMLVDMSEFEGWEARAAWDDFSLGLKHGNYFEKLAIYGHKNWQNIAAKIGSWFIDGEMKAFEDRKEALEWLKADS